MHVNAASLWASYAKLVVKLALKVPDSTLNSLIFAGPIR